MSFDLPLDLETRVTRYAEKSHLSADEAVLRLLKSGLAQTEPEKMTPAQRMIGLFSNPEDVALMEEVDAVIAAERRFEIVSGSID